MVHENNNDNNGRDSGSVKVHLRNIGNENCYTSQAGNTTLYQYDETRECILSL